LTLLCVVLGDPIRNHPSRLTLLKGGDAPSPRVQGQGHDSPLDGLLHFQPLGLDLATSFNAISRHEEAGTDCVLCQRGPGEHPAEDFVWLVTERRKGFGMATHEWRRQEDDR
jgi:hypothetical protein